MSIETRGHGSELVTACHGFRQPYDFLVRFKGGGSLPPPFGGFSYPEIPDNCR
jgi:hypothetical protein